MRYAWGAAAVLLLAFGAYELKQAASPKGTAVLIDKRTGRRFEVVVDDGSMTMKERLERAARLAPRMDIAGSGDLESRKHRAYGALLGTVAAALLAVLYVRRSLKS